MKVKLSLFITGLLLSVFSVFGGTGEGVRASLVTDAPVPLTEGSSFTAIVVLDLQPGWHTYWEYPGDAGFPTKIKWHLPDGWSASPVEFSIPRSFREPGDLIIYGYENQSLIRAVITPKNNLAPNQIFDLKATVSWLACKELCVPGSAEVSTRVGSGGSNLSTKQNSIPEALQAASWPSSKEFPFPVSITKKNGMAYIAFTGREGAIYTLFPDPKDDIQGDITHGPVTTLSSNNAYSIMLPWTGNSSFHALLKEEYGGSIKAWWISKNNITDIYKSTSYSSINILLAALISGFLGGLILNLMPCVLPVISLKIFGFISQSGETPKRILLHGFAFAGGILSWFLGLALVVIILKSGGSQITWGAFQFQNPLFVVFLCAIVLLFALNLFGVFEFCLPLGGVPIDHLASKEGYLGSYFQGLFATLLATPCTAPFLGSALGFAFGQSPAVIFAMFTSVALGMALPYLILSANPAWRSLIPKPGPWMERLKQFMGFPLMGTAIWLLWVLQQQRGPLAVLLMLLLLLILGFCAWIFGILSASRSESFSRVFLLIILATLASGSLWVTVQQIVLMKPGSIISQNGSASSVTVHAERISWIPYSSQGLSALRAEGKPVLLDFTASWCLTCQFNERTAIDTAAVRQLLKEKGITAMKGDWTSADPTITAALKSFDRVGVPLVVYYPPGNEGKPLILPELLTERLVIDALKK